MIEKFFRIITDYPLDNVALCQKITFAVASIAGVISKFPEGELFESVFIRVLELFKAHEKSRSNTIRALGILLNASNHNFRSQGISIEDDRINLDKTSNLTILEYSMSQIMHSLKSQNLKLKWNTCHMLGSLFENKNLLFSSELIKQVCKCLVDANYKVRISATIAISSISKVRSVKEDLDEILCGLEGSLITDDRFGEYSRILRKLVPQTLQNVINSVKSFGSNSSITKAHTEFLDEWLPENQLITLDSLRDSLENDTE
jgi:hypothetical protein